MQFTETVQETFRNTTATVINRYCADNNEQCRETVAVARRRYSLSLQYTECSFDLPSHPFSWFPTFRGQVSLIQPSDVIITNIRNNAQGELEFEMYIQVAGGAQVLGIGVLESAVQVNMVLFCPYCIMVY